MNTLSGLCFHSWFLRSGMAIHYNLFKLFPIHTTQARAYLASSCNPALWWQERGCGNKIGGLVVHVGNFSSSHEVLREHTGKIWDNRSSGTDSLSSITVPGLCVRVRASAHFQFLVLALGWPSRSSPHVQTPYSVHPLCIGSPSLPRTNLQHYWQW